MAASCPGNYWMESLESLESMESMESSHSLAAVSPQHPSAAGRRVMWTVTDSSASPSLNPGFNQSLVDPGVSQPWKCHSEQDWDRQSLHRECKMYPEVQLFPQ